MNFISLREKNEFRDVFAAMELSGKLLLEEHSVHDSYSQISDSLMKLIKMTSSPGPDDGPINNNSFGCVNKKFIRFFIDMLSLKLAFDNRYVSLELHVILHNSNFSLKLHSQVLICCTGGAFSFCQGNSH